jgi:DNA-binding XRE family transcriptional regulator
MELGQVIKRAREAAGLTQEALAYRAGVSVSAVSKLERDQSPETTFWFVVKLAQVLPRRVRQHVDGGRRLRDRLHHPRPALAVGVCS